MQNAPPRATNQLRQGLPAWGIPGVSRSRLAYSPTVNIFEDSTTPSADRASTLQEPVQVGRMFLQLQVRNRGPLTCRATVAISRSRQIQTW